MRALSNAVLALHIASGFVALVTFWIPACTAKGGSLHRRAGWTYVAAMLVVSATAVVRAALLIAAPTAMRDFTGVPAADVDTLAAVVRVIGVFFVYLALVTFTAGWQGIGALRGRGRRRRWGAVSLALQVANVVAAPPGLWLGAMYGQPLLVMFAMICFFIGVGPLIRRWRGSPADSPAAAHLTGMITTGIAAHTAFLSFGVRRFVPELYDLSPALYLIPWIMPAFIGAAAVSIMRRRALRGQFDSGMAIGTGDLGTGLKPMLRETPG